MTAAPIHKSRLPALAVGLAIAAICLGVFSIWSVFTANFPVSPLARHQTLARLIPSEALTLAKGGFMTLAGALALLRKSWAFLSAALMTGLTGLQFLWRLDYVSYGRAMPDGVMPFFAGYWLLTLLLCVAFTVYLGRLGKTGVLR